MGRAQSIAFMLQPTRPGQPPTLGVGPHTLANLGYNLRVEIATASAFVNNVPSPAQRQSIQVWGHLDTGAARTAISPIIATHIGLVQTGASAIHTANGSALNPTYAIDLIFAGTTLKARTDLGVASCTLPFTLAAHQSSPNDPKNVGVLIGRDIMAAWHIMWDGPTSTIVISD